MKKTILFMLSTWQESYSKVILKGMEKFVKDRDVEVQVANAYGADTEYFVKENEIFLLVDVKKYDGVVMLFNGEGTGDLLAKYSKECIENDIPAVSIDVSVPGMAYCGIDNYLSIYKITEHLIREHNVTKLQFIGGPEDHPDSVERGRAFCDCLKDHGLEPYGFGYYGFRRSTGKKAYEEAKNSGRPMAEAYVCANDYCALGFCTAAKEDGLEPPKDFLITGFDNLEEARNYYPSLTTVDRDLEGLGYNSLLHLLDIIEGRAAKDSTKSISGLVIKGGSCGCEKARDISTEYLEMQALFTRRNQNDTLQKGARERLCGNASFEQYQDELHLCVEQKGLADFSVGISQSITNPEGTRLVGYDEIMDVYGSNFHTRLCCSEQLIPDDFRDDHTKIYWLGTLHCKERTLGYSIFKYTSDLLDFQYHRTMNETASLAVENIRQSIILSEMNQKLEHLYIRDSLTGLLNRFGYNSFAGRLYRENNGRVYIVFIDMDNLKVLNDSYGHDYGDIALKGIAEAIKSVYTDTEVKVRMGGDEFLVMGAFHSEEELLEKEKQVDEFLEEYAVRMNLPIKLEVSKGHSFYEEECRMESTKLESLLQFADVKMYENKQKKKRRR